MQIWLHNIYYQNIIALKKIIIVVKKDRKNKEFLVIKNIEKTAIMEVAKALSAIHFRSKHSKTIINLAIKAAKDLRLINIKKY